MKRFILFDTETTGLDPSQNHIIEVGAIALDENLNEITRYSSLIKWYYMDPIRIDWDFTEKEAAKVHKIPYTEIIKNGKDPMIVGEEFLRMIIDIGKDLSPKNKKPILVSNNAQFDTAFLLQLISRRNLFKHAHYSVWDLNLLFNYIDVPEEFKYIPKHRAIGDVEGLLKKWRYVVDKLNN